MVTDQEILERHDVEVRPRCRMELQIVDKLLELAKAAGYAMKIIQYEEEGEKTPEDVKDALFNLDEAHLEFYKDGKRVGWVFLVFGNDGFDLISDYTCRLEEFLKPAIELSGRLENGLE